MALPTPQSRNTESPEPRSGGRRNQQQRTGHPNLKIADVAFDKNEAKILQAKEPEPGKNQYNNAIILKLAFRGAIFLWNLKADNPCYETLHAAYGANVNNWVDGKFYLYLIEDEFSGAHWMRVDVIQPKKRT